MTVVNVVNVPCRFCLNFPGHLNWVGPSHCPPAGLIGCVNEVQSKPYILKGISKCVEEGPGSRTERQRTTSTLESPHRNRAGKNYETNSRKLLQ